MSSSIVTEMQRTFMHLRVPMDPLPPAGQLVAGPQQCTCYRCKPNLYRTHRPNPGTFKIGQHDYYALATHAVAWFTVPVVIEPRDVPSGLYEPRVLQAGQQVQLGARDVWRRLQQEFRFLRDYLTSGALTKFIAEKIVPYAMGIFDMVFFLGAFCPRNDRRNPAHRLQLRVLAVESTIKSRIQPEGDRVALWINPHHPYHVIEPNRSLNSITVLHTLIQEMVNAFFDLFGCYNGTTCGKADCRFVSRQNIGNGRGRGRAWQMLAKAIEDEAPRLLPGFTPRFERLPIMVDESMQGGYTPTTCDLQHVCGDLELTARVLQKVRTRDDDDKMMAKVHRWAARDTVVPGLDLRRTKSEVLIRDGIDF